MQKAIKVLTASVIFVVALTWISALVVGFFSCTVFKTIPYSFTDEIVSIQQRSETNWPSVQHSNAYYIFRFWCITAVVASTGFVAYRFLQKSESSRKRLPKES